MILLTISWG